MVALYKNVLRFAAITLAIMASQISEMTPVNHLRNLSSTEDWEFPALSSFLRKVGMKIVRPIALGSLALVLAANQGYVAYNSLVIGFLVLVLSATGYARRFAYFIIFYFALLTLTPAGVIAYLHHVVETVLASR